MSPSPTTRRTILVLTTAPFYLLFLQEAKLPLDLVMERAGELVPVNYHDYVVLMKERLEKAFDIVRLHLRQGFQRSKQTYNARVKKLQFKEGDLVWYCLRRRLRRGPKWQLWTTGPWSIVKAINAVNFVIHKAGVRRDLVVHVDRLRHYESPQAEEIRPLPGNREAPSQTPVGPPRVLSLSPGVSPLAADLPLVPPRAKREVRRPLRYM